MDLSDTTFFTRVDKYDGHNVFLVVAWDYEYYSTVYLGKNSVTPPFTEFIKESFIKESDRSGVFLVDDTMASINYNLNIEIMEFKIESKYYRTGNAVGNYQRLEIKVSPSVGNLGLTAKVFDSGGNVVFSKDYKSIKTTEYTYSRSRSESQINKNMMQNMTETLSQCIKENITEIVKDLNKFITN